MRWNFWLLVGGVAAGYFVYRCLQEIDRKIGEEISFHPALDRPPERREVEAGRPAGAEAPARGDMEGRILAAVRAQPGILQTELYLIFPEESRRNLQELLLRMTREAVLVRERAGNTFRLYASGAED